MLYSLRGLFNTNHTDINKMATFIRYFAVTVDISVKRLARRNEMKMLKLCSSLDKMSGGSGRNSWLIQTWPVCHWHPVCFKSLSFEKWQYCDMFSGACVLHWQNAVTGTTEVALLLPSGIATLWVGRWTVQYGVALWTRYTWCRVDSLIMTSRYAVISQEV